MPRKEPEIGVPLSEEDGKAFARLQASLENISARKLGRILLHYGIWHADEAIGSMVRDALNEKTGD